MSHHQEIHLAANGWLYAEGGAALFARITGQIDVRGVVLEAT